MSVQPRPFVDGDARRARDLDDLDDGAVASHPRVRVWQWTVGRRLQRSVAAAMQ